MKPGSFRITNSHNLVFVNSPWWYTTGFVICSRIYLMFNVPFRWANIVVRPLKTIRGFCFPSILSASGTQHSEKRNSQCLEIRLSPTSKWNAVLNETFCFYCGATFIQSMKMKPFSIRLKHTKGVIFLKGKATLWKDCEGSVPLLCAKISI